MCYRFFCVFSLSCLWGFKRLVQKKGKPVHTYDSITESMHMPTLNGNYEI